MFDFNLGSSGESGSSSGGLRLSVSAPVVIVLCLWRAEQLFDALTLEQGMLLRVIILLGFAGMKQRIINYVGQLEDKLWISIFIVTWVVNTVATWCVTVSRQQANIKQWKFLPSKSVVMADLPESSTEETGHKQPCKARQVPEHIHHKVKHHLHKEAKH